MAVWEVVQTSSHGGLGHTYVWISRLYSLDILAHSEYVINVSAIQGHLITLARKPKSSCCTSAFHSCLIWDSGHRSDLTWSLWTRVLCCRATRCKFDTSGRSSGPAPSSRFMHLRWLWSLSEAKGLMCTCFTVHTRFSLGNSVYGVWFCPHWSPQTLLSTLRVSPKCHPFPG